MSEFWEFAQQYRPAADTPFLNSNNDYRYFSELLIENTNHHPFRHLLFASWLFPSPKGMFEIEREMCQGNPKSSLKENRRRNEQRIESKCLELMRKRLSLNSIYKLTGKSRCYLKRLALLNSIPIKLKPKILSSERIARVVHLARAGTHRALIAKQCGIGVGSVEQIISSEPNLVEFRRKGRWESKRRRCKAAILKYKKHNPKALRKDFQYGCNQAYYWLYSYDRGWLEATLPLPIKPQGRKLTNRFFNSSRGKS